MNDDEFIHSFTAQAHYCVPEVYQADGICWRYKDETLTLMLLFWKKINTEYT